MAGLALDLSGLDAIESLAKKRALTLKAVKAGAKIIQAAAKARAPRRKGSGALKQSMGIKSVKGTRGKTLAFAVIGARRKVVKMVKPPRGTKLIKAVPANYMHLVEKGTKPHLSFKGSSRKTEAKHPGLFQHFVRHPGARARPFLGPAFQATKVRAGVLAAEALAVELEKAIAQQSARLLAKLSRVR